MSGSSAISLLSWTSRSDSLGATAAAAAADGASASLLEVVQAVFSDGELADIKARIHLVEQRRQALGPPVPIPGHPMPTEGLACRRCRREYRSTRNTMCGPSAKSPFLEPSRPGATDCKPCRNVKRWAFPTWDYKELQASIDGDEVFFVKYLIVVFLYEDFNEDKAGAIVACAADLPSPLQLQVYAESSVVTEGALMLGVLWPIDIYRAHNDGKYPPKHLIKNYAHNGMKIRGLIREPVHGNPIGTVKLTEKVSEGIRKSGKLGDSATAARGKDQIQELYEALRANSAVSITAVDKKADDHEDTLGVSFKVGDKAAIDEDVNDFLNSLWQHDSLAGLATSTSTPKKQRTGGSSSVVGSSSSGANNASVTSPPAGNRTRGTCTDSAAGAAVHSTALGASETIVFKCRLLAQDLYNDVTVLHQTPKKLEGQLKLIKGRMSDKVMEHYAADYGKTKRKTFNTSYRLYGPPCVSD